MTRIKDIEAREKAAPLTDEEYAEWKGNIEAIAGMQAGEWYRMEGGKLVLVQARPDGGAGMTTTIGIQLRLFATIDALQDRLRDREEKLEEAEKLRQMVVEDSETHKGARRTLGVQVAVTLGHILKGGD